MKIGILTLPFSPNYGWALQLWALNWFLKSKGHNPIVIERKWNRKNQSSYYKFQSFVYYHILCRRLWRFNCTKFTKTGVIRKGNEIPTNLFDGYIVGSDQVWRIENTRGADLNFFLDFLPDENKSLRIAYAASFGKDQWKGTEEETQQVRQLLNKFDLITVREKSGVTLCKELFNVKAHHVLDPTLLLKAEDYNRLIPQKRKCQHLLATYILDPSQSTDKIVSDIAKLQRLKPHHLYKRTTTPFYIYYGIEHWLITMRDADFVIVDSFHGLCFCLIFEKQFLVIANKKRGLTRFTSLLESVGLEDRLIWNDQPCIDEKVLKSIDYQPVREKLNVMRLSSSELLLSKLKESTNE